MAQFNSLTDRVRQMLGGIVQQAPKTLSGIGNAIAPNLSASMQGAKTLSQNVSYFAPKAIQNVGRAIANPQTAQPNFDLLRQNSPKNVLGKFATNTIANAGESFFSGANQMVDASNTYAKNKYSPVSYVKGAMGLAKMVAPTTPFFQGATALQSGGQSFKIPLVERLATGGLRGQTNANINPLMQEQKINTPVGSFDPITAIGSLAGFTKNPAWNEIFKETSLLLKTAPGANKLLGYLSTRGTKGGVEGFIQGLSEIRDDMTPKDVVMTLAGQTGFGIASEIVMDKGMEKTGQLIKKMAKVARETFTTISPNQKAFNQRGMVDINAPVGKPIFDGEYKRGDVSRLTEEMDKILGIPKDIKSLKQKQTLFEQNYRAMQEAADAGMPEAKADLDKFTRLYNEADVVRKAKDVKVESQYSGYKRVPTPEELRAKMAQDAQRATKAGTQATGGIDAVWNNDPTLKARIDKAFDTGDTATVQKLLPQVPEQYKANYVANTSQPKTTRTIKVVDQSRTQQPISSPASDSVGTQAGAPVGQTAQSSLGTESLNKSIPQRGFAESVQSNKKTPAEIKPELEKIRYEPIANADIMAQADKIIKSSESKALDFAKNNTDTTANSVSLKLIEKYLDQGRFSEANDLITAVSPRFTKAGQEIQILSTYGRLTPTGAIKYAQTLINQANKANPRLNLKLTEANTKIITEFANKVQSLPEGSRERVVATAQLMQKISDQIPATIGQKIATIQTMMQLLNPKTAVRNILGNTIFTGAENVSDVFATGIDRVTSLITGKRSKVLPSLSAQGKGFGKGLKEGYQDAMLGIDTSGGVSSQFDIKGKTFTDPILGTLEKALNIELRVPDRAAYTAAFEGSLNNQMRAGGVTKATPEMIEIAHADGLYRTFQDNSRLAQIFSGIKKTLNKIGTPDGKFGLGDFVLKYPKTPANILSRGLDYSPAGFVKGIYEGVRPFISGQEFNQKQFVESLSRAMTGTGLIAAGYVLAKNGIISGKNDKDYDISSVKRTTGQGAFKMNVSALARYFQSGGQKQDDQNGDTLVSYDWAQPTSIQVAMGANSALGGSAEDIASIASDNLQAGVDTLTGQSMVKNLMDYAGGVKDKGFVGATQDMVLNSATGFIPSVLRQSSNVFDPTQRSTYAETPGGVAINKAKATIPFLRNTLEPKLDVFGKEMPNYEGSGLQRIFDIFVNPAFVTKIQENPAAKEVIDIYQRSGLTTQAPRVADSKIKINGQDIKVSPQQYTEYQKYIGTKTDKTFNSLMTDPLFMKSSDEEKAKFLQGVLTDINSAAKIELFGNKPKTIPQDVKDVIKSSGDLTGRMVTLTKEGNLKMATGDIEYPKLTGNTELDKKLITAYRGKITQKANEITAMYEAGEITAAQAETELNKLIELKSKVSTKKAKKAPKITVRKLSAPKVAKSARIKIKIPKLKKPKTLKLKKYTVKLSK